MLKLETFDHSPLVTPCSKCGARRRITGFLPHEQYRNWKVEQYQCVSCGERSEETVTEATRH